MKIYVKTYGCQMNERDSEMVAVLLTRHGHLAVDRENEADVIIINTCSVRGKAEDKALGKLRLMVLTKREYPNRIVGAMGCMVQRLGRDILKKVPGLDFAVGTHRLALVPAIVGQVVAGRGPVIDTAVEEMVSDPDTHRPDGPSAFINILYGCDRYCSYCVVPYVRGHEWSRPARDVIEETRLLVAHGVREVTLLGQSVMSYGRVTNVWEPADRSPLSLTEPLPRLLEALTGVEGLRRVRFTSGHPSGCTAELARAMASLPAVCEHLHLPLQTGSDRILKLMNRGYTVQDYRDAVARLRAATPTLELTTDIILGYPTETEDDFQQTAAFMNEIGFANAYIFKYNPRPGTPAALLPDDVSDDEKARRNRILLDDQDRRGLEIYGRCIGHEVEVLVEGRSPRNDVRWSGRTRTNMIVVFDDAPGLAPGVMATVDVASARPQTLYGRVVRVDGSDGVLNHAR